jgi:CheY-like chemotaxis protein
MSKIVIVEDEPSISEVVSLYLKRAGYQVTCLADGDAAQAAFQESLPDLVILDVMLPGVDGFSLTRNLRDRSDVPIILLTSRREESDRIAGLELGADDTWSNRSARRNWSAASAPICGAPRPALRPRKAARFPLKTFKSIAQTRDVLRAGQALT